VYIGYWCRNLRKINHFEDQGVDGMIILKWNFLGTGMGDIDWIDLGGTGGGGF
jgi:hypothetical protein